MDNRCKPIAWFSNSTKSKMKFKPIELDETALELTRRTCSDFSFDEIKKKRKKREKECSPDGHALRFKMMPSLIHLVQSTLKHNRVILTRQRAQQLAPRAVQRGVHVPVRLDFRLEILQR